MRKQRSMRLENETDNLLLYAMLYLKSSFDESVFSFCLSVY